MSSLTFDELKKLTVNSQQANLYEKLINYDEKKLEEIFIENLKDPDLPRILNIILNQLSSTSDGLKRKNHISKNVLDAVIITQFNELSNEQMNSLLSYLSLELDSLSTRHILKLIDYSLNDLQDPQSTNIVWKHLIPTLLHTIKDENEIEYDGTLMTGEEVKCRVITSICIIRWRENIMVPLADMFKSLENILKPAEHSQIIGKFCSRFENIQPENMPQLVNHLLSLCKNKNTLLLLFKLNLYYQNIRNAGEGGHQKCYDEISQASSNISEVTSSVNNVIHYIQAHLNLFGQSCWRQLLAGCRQLSGKPEALLDPFILTLVITFTQPNLKTQQESLDLLRSTFLNHINEVNCQKESQWLRRNTPKLPEISQALNYIVKFSFSQSFSFTEGLIETGFWFLSISGRGPQIEYLSTIGQTILTAFIISFGRAQRILTRLTQCIMFKKGDKRFTNCLNHLCLKVPQSINKNRELILELLKHGASKMPNTCQEIILAIVPLVKRFTSFRENLIILLRSSLSTWDVNVRKMAVLGFLQLLKAHEISGFGALSQMSCLRSTLSSPSPQPLTQGRAETREAICQELLVILQRCLNQQAQVRLIFYQGLYGSIHKNKELCPFLLTKLHSQINLVLSDENAAIPFDMNVCVENKETHAIIKEPLGHLIFASQQVVQMGNQSELLSADLRQMNKLLGSLSERVAALTHNDLKINSPQDFQANKVENAVRLAQLALLSSVCEALLCYALSKPPKPNPAPGVALSLFKRFQEITDFLKSVGKKSDSDQKRKGRKRTAAEANSDNDAPSPSAKVRNTGRPPSEDEEDNSGDQDEVVMELIAEMPNKFKCPPTVLNLKACTDLLNICFSINEKVDNVPLSRSREFQCYVLTSLNNLLLSEVSPRFEFRTLLDQISKCLFKVLDDHNASSQCSLALNCFESLWSLLSKRCPDYFEKHLVITGGDPDTVLKRLEKLLEETLSTEEDTDMDKKYIISIVSALSKLVLILPTTHETVHNAFAWLRKLIQRTYSTNTNAVRCIFTLLLTLDRRINSTTTLLDNMALTIQKVLSVYVEKQVESYTHLDMISEDAAPEILTCFLNNITLKLEDCRLLQVRLKAELVLPKPLEELDEILERSELELCKYLSHITKLLEYLTRARIPIGKLSTLLVKNIIILYQHTGVLCKYFILRCSPTRLSFQRARFENLIKLACYILKDTLLEFYIYIKKQSSKTKSTNNTKNSKTKSIPVHHDEKQLQRMVLVSEQCEKAILALSKKTKISLTGLIKVAGGREIRFENHKIGRLLAKQAATGTQAIESSVDGEDNEEEEEEEEQAEEEDKDEEEEEDG